MVSYTTRALYKHPHCDFLQLYWQVTVQDRWQRIDVRVIDGSESV